MKVEYDFSQAEQGKFYNSDVDLYYPIYLEPDVNDSINKIAKERDIDAQFLVNEWLRKDIKLIEITQQK